MLGFGKFGLLLYTPERERCQYKHLIREALTTG